MKNSHIFVLITFVLNLIIGCDSHPTKSNSIPEANQKNIIDTKDSIVECSLAQIKQHYYEFQQQEQYKIELELVGERTFENDSILILSFDETIKFGSWSYNNSSLIFHKAGNQLLPIKPDIILEKEFADSLDEINYPNRIRGKFDKSIDLTGDGIPEYLFKQRNTHRDFVAETTHIYKIDLQKNKVHQVNLKSFSRGFIFAEDTLDGDNEKLEIIKSNQNELLIQIKHITTKRNSLGTLDVIADKLTYYKYNTKAQKFIEIKNK